MCMLILMMYRERRTQKFLAVENDSSIAIDGYKALYFDYVADEDVMQGVIS